MNYLLDVNALIALGFKQHVFHRRVTAWIGAQRISALASCAITELGFIRVLTQAPVYGLNFSHTRGLLLQLKNNRQIPFTFMTDDQDARQLPIWVKVPRQLTDGHLLRLAQSHGAMLATLDEKIPGAHLIPVWERTGAPEDAL